MHIHIDPDVVTAPFEQIRTQIATMVSDGTLSAGTKLPTVRQLATELGLAANTVAKAYRELESDGVISTDGRRGSFVRSTVVSGGPAPDLRAAAEAYVLVTRRAGLSQPEALRLVEQSWSRSQ
ncbi:MAG: GntR family transcriptional regulator [Propionibacteriaceae bacterium]|jgi:DNA-binding transcriptional regulator YhcF (GntR family)|nr:GntR family transcriptional regulator [Propionibacteriaceae bacterium]